MNEASPTCAGHPAKPGPLVFVSASAVDINFPAPPGVFGCPAPPRILTVFHFLVLLGLGAGMALGWHGGARWFGAVGGLAGAVIGGYAGFQVGRLPEQWVLRLLAGSLAAMTSDELRSCLRDPRCQIPNLVLLELQWRGEDIRQELGGILDLLGSEDIAQRGHGWAALASAFPDVAGQLRNYRVGDSVAECRNKVEELRAAAGEFVRPAQ